MQTNKEMEPEIRLRDCLFHLLYHWRSLIAAALIGALVFGGYAYWQNQNRKSSKTETAAVQEASQTETNYGNSNAIYSQLLEGSDAWRKESVLMQVDPYRVWESIAVFGVAPEEGQGADLAVAIAQAYPAGILSAVDEAQVRQIYGEAGAREVADLLSGEADSETGVSFTMKAIGTTKEMADRKSTRLNSSHKHRSRMPSSA